MSNKVPIIISGRTGGRAGPRIPGVFASSRFGEQVVSTGIPSLDSYIGGGIPLGSLCILRDTFPSRYADLVLKCFIAEGATYNHHIYVAANNKVSSKTFSEELPGLKRNPNTTTNQVSQDDNSNNDLKIAWRYGVTNNTQSNTTSIVKGQKEAKFEFKKKTTASELGSTNLTISMLFDNVQLEPVDSDKLLNEIAHIVKPFEIYDLTKSQNSSLPVKKPVTNLIRIAISHCEEQVLNPHFMMKLRALIKYTNSCAVLTVSSAAYNSNSDPSSLVQCERLADYVIRFETILDDKRKTELGDVDGLVEVLKMISSNTIKPNEPPRDLGFSFRNKRLTFQELHIPPEGENTVQRETSSKSAAIVSSSSCGVTVKGKSIDF